MTKRLERKATLYPHETIWRNAEFLIGKAKTNNIDAYYYRLSALLMATLAYEGYINFLGNILLPELWKDEKNNFQGKTLEDKIQTIIQKRGLDFDLANSKGKNPYQAIKSLEKFRNSVTHPKVTTNSYSATFKKDDDNEETKKAFPWDLSFDAYIDSNKLVEDHMDSIRKFCQSLQDSCEKVCDEDDHIFFPVFEGPLGFGEGTIKNID